MNLNKFDYGTNGVSVNRNKEYVDVDNDTLLMVTSPKIYIYKYEYEYKHIYKNTTIHIATKNMLMWTMTRH